MSDFGLIRPFDIDNGELDGLTPQQVFVLGYELASVDALLKLPDAIDQLVHADNRDRIARGCKDAGRLHRFEWMQGDSSESWLMLRVAPTAQGEARQ